MSVQVETGSEPVAFEVTFNKPFQEAVSTDQSVASMRVTFANGELSFTPSAEERPKDGFPIELRRRGGYQASIEGTDARHLMNAFVAAGGSRRLPFFTLEKAGDEWVARHFVRPGENPPKIVPHVRFWPPVDPAEKQSEFHEDNESHKILGDFSTTVRSAFETVARHEAGRSYGRRPQHVKEAMEVTGAFEKLVEEVIPAFGQLRSNMQKLIQAHEMLASFLNPILKTPMASERMVESDTVANFTGTENDAPDAVAPEEQPLATAPQVEVPKAEAAPQAEVPKVEAAPQAEAPKAAAPAPVEEAAPAIPARPATAPVAPKLAKPAKAGQTAPAIPPRKGKLTLGGVKTDEGDKGAALPFVEPAEAAPVVAEAKPVAAPVAPAPAPAPRPAPAAKAPVARPAPPPQDQRDPDYIEFDASEQDEPVRVVDEYSQLPEEELPRQQTLTPRQIREMKLASRGFSPVAQRGRR